TGVLRSNRSTGFAIRAWYQCVRDGGRVFRAIGLSSKILGPSVSDTSCAGITELRASGCQEEFQGENGSWHPPRPGNDNVALKTLVVPDCNGFLNLAPAFP